MIHRRTFMPRYSSLSLLVMVWFVRILPAQTAYYRHAFFDNSLQRDFYWNSSAVATAPSTLEAKNWRLPVDTNTFLSPPNALRLHWHSAPGGGWDAEIHLVNFRNRAPELAGARLRKFTRWISASQPPPGAECQCSRSAFGGERNVFVSTGSRQFFASSVLGAVATALEFQ